jgi:hypothetical protein
VAPVIAEYDPEWPALFESEAESTKRSLGLASTARSWSMKWSSMKTPIDSATSEGLRASLSGWPSRSEDESLLMAWRKGLKLLKLEFFRTTNRAPDPIYDVTDEDLKETEAERAKKKRT